MKIQSSVKSTHLIHSLHAWSIHTIKRAIAVLYNNKCLRGVTREYGIRLARKIFKKRFLTESEIINARLVIWHHADNLSELINNQQFQI